MKTHILKTDPDVFEALVRGDKTYEIRFDDRGFSVGDALCIQETKSSGHDMANGAALEYTGRTTARTVTHILRGPLYGLSDGWVILSVDNPARDAINQAEAIEQWAGCLEKIILHVETEHAKDPNYPTIGAEGMGEFAADMREAAARLLQQAGGGALNQSEKDPHPDCELECGAYGTYCKCNAEGGA
ncbi:DUF3850 domain-containing protein [Halomonas sp. ISL-60]|uniref:DUF3850 domain-containing protein n=1 Tax=Halomonas sp. ISL-56 TaxID=2819149 RepID=UPI001BEC2061|nr:DUF3850 domain-containing protein [Halomonas sp. ISL-56]MBT2773799.1 DUF3850 domain-containing protein [Halomonas sp. ISL-60]MBT2800017.1 DUF3850 domain-containing protein [Halomonas sp. ISL-56]